MIGRLQWAPPPAVPQADQTLEWIVGGVVVAVVGIFLLGRFAFRGRTRKPKGPRPANMARQQAEPGDAWLGQTEGGEEPMEEPTRSDQE